MPKMYQCTAIAMNRDDEE